MKLALVLGLKQGNNLKERLNGIKDNLVIECFEDVPEFINMALKKNAIYDRILVLSKKITKSNINDLYEYWSISSKETQIVMLSKKGADEDQANLFLNTFKTPIATAMLVSSTTVQIVAEAVLLSIPEINSKYGISNYMEADIDDDTYADVEQEIQQQPIQQPIQQPVQQVQQPANQQPAMKKQKSGFLGGLFGGKKQKSQENDYQESYDGFDNSSLEESTYGESYEEGQYIEQPEYVEQSIPEEYDTGDNYESQPTEVANWDTPSSSQTPIQDENLNVDDDLGSFTVNDSYENDFEEVNNNTNDFDPEGIAIEEDFGNEGLGSQPEESSYKANDSMSVDDDLGGVDVSSDEESYRKQVEAPKVVTKTVVKEVIRNTGGKLVALTGVNNGRLKKIVVVTGDRGTGVTSTALNIAKTLAQKVDVLYFDCDVTNHGLMNYIDYNNFKNYENIHMEGVKYCKTSQAFDSCVISWEENLYLLTTDYSCDCSDDEVRRAGEIVAERSIDFGVVVVDCPVDKLYLIPDLVLTGNTVMCVEGSRRGFMNMLCQFESSTLITRCKRQLVSRGAMFVTKCNKKTDLNKLIAYIKAIYEPDEVDWLLQKPVPFDGRLNDTLLNDILEG